MKVLQGPVYLIKDKVYNRLEKANHLALRNFKWSEEAMIEDEEEIETRH